MNQNLCWCAHVLTSQLVCCVFFFPHQLSKPFVLAVKCQNHQCAELLITRYRGMVSTYSQYCIYHSLVKEHPWAEHLTSLPKKRVGALSVCVSACKH